MRTLILDLIDWISGNGFSFDQLRRFFLPLEILAAALSIGLIIVIVYLLFLIRKDIVNSLEMMAESASSEKPQKVSDSGWQSVINKLESGSEDSYKQAVIEADKMFDDLLKRNGYQGGDMGERLKQVTSEQLTSIDEVWQAHRMRNRLVHEPDFELKEHEARRMVEIYERAFQDLKAL